MYMSLCLYIYIYDFQVSFVRLPNSLIVLCFYNNGGGREAFDKEGGRGKEVVTFVAAVPTYILNMSASIYWEEERKECV